MKNDAKASSSPASRAATPVTDTFAARIFQRCGTAVNVVRIRPVEYSEVNASTPRMLTARTAYAAEARRLTVSESSRRAGAGARLAAMVCVTRTVMQML